MTTTRRLTTAVLAATVATTLATTPAQAHRPDSGGSNTTQTTTGLPAFHTAGTLPHYLDPPDTTAPSTNGSQQLPLPTSGTLSGLLQPDTNG